MTEANTLFLRLEGPLQAWGDTSKFVIRRTMDAPTKSGVLGLLCCAMGLSREKARERLPELNGLAMGVRIDRHGTRWWDYQTVGAGIGMTTAGNEVKTGAQGTLITRREYLADASFLVALQGDAKLIHDLAAAIASPKWPVFLGRKSCPPSVPILVTRKREDRTCEPHIETGRSLLDALKCVPWQPRLPNFEPDKKPDKLACILEWRATDTEPEAPNDAEVWYDAPVAFDPPVHHPRLVTRTELTCGANGVSTDGATQERVPRPPRPHANYNNAEWKSETLIADPADPSRKVPKGMRPRRLQRDHGLCVFCKAPANTVQHITYRRAGGDETLEDLRSLCRLCHDAVTMLEYGLGMGLDRINPEEPRWRKPIIQKRAEIVEFRSLETRRRRLAAEEVE